MQLQVGPRLYFSQGRLGGQGGRSEIGSKLGQLNRQVSACRMALTKHQQTCAEFSRPMQNSALVVTGAALVAAGAVPVAEAAGAAGEAAGAGAALVGSAAAGSSQEASAVDVEEAIAQRMGKINSLHGPTDGADVCASQAPRPSRT